MLLSARDSQREHGGGAGLGVGQVYLADFGQPPQPVAESVGVHIHCARSGRDIAEGVEPGL
jgi:hypothetical protein